MVYHKNNHFRKYSLIEALEMERQYVKYGKIMKYTINYNTKKKYFLYFLFNFYKYKDFIYKKNNSYVCKKYNKYNTYNLYNKYNIYNLCENNFVTSPTFGNQKNRTAIEFLNKSKNYHIMNKTQTNLSITIHNYLKEKYILN